MIRETDEPKIKELYFKYLCTFDEIAEKLKNKYSARDIKSYIINYIDLFDKTVKENKKQKKV